MKHLDELFAVPRSEFTRTRQKLVAKLRESGAHAEAKALAEVRKPSAALWAVNQVARHHGEALRRLIDAVDELKRYQVRGGADVGKATERERTAVRELTDHAARVLERGGERASRPTLERVSNTLLGAAVDRKARVDLQHGRLSGELPAPGFEALMIGGRFPKPTLRLVKSSRNGPDTGDRDSRDARAAHARASREVRAARVRESRDARATRIREEREARAARVRELEATVAERRRAAEEIERKARELRAELASLESQADKERAASRMADTTLRRVKGRRPRG